MVHQHFQLIPVFTVAENVVLGGEPTNGPFLDLSGARQAIIDIGEQYGLSIDPDAVVGDLSVGQQQRVELVKALYRQADVLILDEPTAVLTPGEADDFFEVIRSLVTQGKSIVFITHKLREVLAVADRITVMRGGVVAGSADPATSTQQSLANLMVGRDVSFEVDKGPSTPAESRIVLKGLSVNDERGLTAVDSLDLDVRGGEIYGVAGVEGNGQRELIEAIAGMRKPSGGAIQLLGADSTRFSPRQVARLGVAHIPEDREKHGVVSEYSIADNMVLNRYHHQPFARRWIRNTTAIRSEATHLVEQYDVRTPSIDVTAGALSGGNRQ
ncbi:UNVERIFIED_CONTAM: hypothetical protein GTU68_065938, partial [Idotea baltica]|nr:hypothetical protein [Idotea baltica]